MSKSPFFARIKTDVLQIVAAIPHGKCSTYKSIGEHLAVVPRHVAYILSTLADLEKAKYPWFRVVGDGGALGQAKVSELGITQAELLRNEGLLVAENGLNTGIERWFVAAADLKSGVEKQTRPADAPRTPVKKTKLSGLSKT